MLFVATMEVVCDVVDECLNQLPVCALEATDTEVRRPVRSHIDMRNGTAGLNSLSP